MHEPKPISKLDHELALRPHLAETMARIDACRDRDELQEIFDERLQTTEDGVLVMAYAYRNGQVTNRPIEMADDLESTLRQIIENRVSAALACSRKVSSRLFDLAKRLPLRDQDKVARDEPIRVERPDEGTHAMMPPSKLIAQPALWKQAVGPRGFRTTAEQLEYDNAQKAARRCATSDAPIRSPRRPWHLDTNQERALIPGPASLSLAQVRRLVAEMEAAFT